MSNGMTIAAASNAYIASKTSYGQGVLDFYGVPVGSGGAGGASCYSGVGIASSLSSSAAIMSHPCGTDAFVTLNAGGANNNVGGFSLGGGSSYLYSIIIPSSSPASISAQQNYGSTGTSSSDMPTLPQPIFLGVQSGAGTTSVGPIYYVRFRAYPPGGTMPSVTYGAFV
jgi:hypothetical protein